VLDGSPHVLRTTTFGTQFAITGLMAFDRLYNNFGCMIASDSMFGSRGGFSGSSYPKKHLAEIECLSVIAVTTN